MGLNVKQHTIWSCIWDLNEPKLTIPKMPSTIVHNLYSCAWLSHVKKIINFQTKFTNPYHLSSSYQIRIMYDPNKHLRLLFIEKSTPFTFEFHTLHITSIIQRKFIQIKPMGILKTQNKIKNHEEPPDLDLEAGFWNIGALRPDLVERISWSSGVPPHFQNTKKKIKKQKLKAISFAFETNNSQPPATSRSRTPFENQQKPRKLIVSDARDEDSKRDPDQELRKTAPKDQILSQKQKIRTKRTKISLFWVCFSCLLIYFFPFSLDMWGSWWWFRSWSWTWSWRITLSKRRVREVVPTSQTPPVAV